jgi:hypothetical protein
LIATACSAITACRSTGAPGETTPAEPAPVETARLTPRGTAAEFFAALEPLCGRAFQGTITEASAPSDADFKDKALIMHVRTCEPNEIRIPFHVGADRSRTWIISRTETGLRLKHDHRHEDGSEDKVTQYGGDTQAPGTSSKQEFHADAKTAEMIPAARTNIWTIEIIPGRTFSYALRREGTDRRFKVDFDLTKPVEAPPAPWGHETVK